MIDPAALAANDPITVPARPADTANTTVVLATDLRGRHRQRRRRHRRPHRRPPRRRPPPPRPVRPSPSRRDQPQRRRTRVHRQPRRERGRSSPTSSPTHHRRVPHRRGRMVPTLRGPLRLLLHRSVRRPRRPPRGHCHRRVALPRPPRSTTSSPPTPSGCGPNERRRRRDRRAGPQDGTFADPVRHVQRNPTRRPRCHPPARQPLGPGVAGAHPADDPPRARRTTTPSTRGSSPRWRPGPPRSTSPPRSPCRRSPRRSSTPSPSGAEIYRSYYKMSQDALIEAVAPGWLRGAFQTDISKRSGVLELGLTDNDIAAALAARNIRVQWVEDWQQPAISAEVPRHRRCSPLRPGTWKRGNGGTLDLGVVRDHTLNAMNDHTALWTEQFLSLMKFGYRSERSPSPSTPEERRSAATAVSSVADRRTRPPFESRGPHPRLSTFPEGTPMPYLPPVEISPRPLPAATASPASSNGTTAATSAGKAGSNIGPRSTGPPPSKHRRVRRMTMTAAGTPVCSATAPPLIAYRKVRAPPTPAVGSPKPDSPASNGTSPPSPKQRSTPRSPPTTPSPSSQRQARDPHARRRRRDRSGVDRDDTPTLHFERRLAVPPDNFLDTDGDRLNTAAGNPLVLGRYPHSQIGGQPSRQVNTSCSPPGGVRLPLGTHPRHRVRPGDQHPHRHHMAHPPRRQRRSDRRRRPHRRHGHRVLTWRGSGLPATDETVPPPSTSTGSRRHPRIRVRCPHRRNRPHPHRPDPPRRPAPHRRRHPNSSPSTPHPTTRNPTAAARGHLCVHSDARRRVHLAMPTTPPPRSPKPAGIVTHPDRNTP